MTGTALFPFVFSADRRVGNRDLQTLSQSRKEESS